MSIKIKLLSYKAFLYLIEFARDSKTREDNKNL